ncbi:apoptosis-inducing factor-like mitchondrion-associated inducer of death [Moniliophthora roreri]|nr:apoptosis-inducing factor-like mitchondrion-associated inducer of death [Moniliophthora roreri]
MSYKETDDKTTTVIVIVGGGSAGVHVARPLSKALDPAKFNIIPINPRPYIIFLIPTLRVVVSDRDRLQEQTFVPYDRVFHNDNGTFVQGEAARINQKSGERHGEVVLTDGQRVGYDILVLATGSKWDGPIAFPKDPSQVASFISGRRQEFAKTQNILLVGRGSVGIELAGEIKDLWPDKKITTIQRDNMLLNGTYPEKMRRHTETDGSKGCQGYYPE